MNFWQIYLTAPLEIKIMLYLIIGIFILGIFITLFRKGLIYGKLRFGGKDRYLTAKETIDAMREAFDIIEERSDIKNNLRIKAQLDYYDQENTFVKKALIQKFEKSIKNQVTPDIKSKSLKNYQLVVDFVLKEMGHLSRQYFKGIFQKIGERAVKEQLSNPNSELRRIIDRKVEWAIEIICELLNKYYNEEDILPMNQLNQINKDVQPEIQKIMNSVFTNAYIVHGKFNDRIQELNASLEKYINKLSS